jgi:hypothetical protein
VRCVRSSPLCEILGGAEQNFCGLWTATSGTENQKKIDFSCIMQAKFVDAVKNFCARQLNFFFTAHHSINPGPCLQNCLCNIALVDRFVPSKHARYVTTDRNTLAPIEFQADEVVAEHSPSHCHLFLAHWNTRLFHWNTRANPSVPDQIVAQRPETHNAHTFSVIGDGRKMLEHWNTHFAQSSSGPPDRRCR